MTTGLVDAALEKIRSADLRRDAEAERGERRVVIVEIEAPRPTLYARPAMVGLPGRRSLGIRAAEPVDLAAVTAEITQALGRDPGRFLASSNSFIVDANGPDILRLAHLPSVAAIWPNTDLQSSAAE